jgi:hypothetical protein
MLLSEHVRAGSLTMAATRDGCDTAVVKCTEPQPEALVGALEEQHYVGNSNYDIVYSNSTVLGFAALERRLNALEAEMNTMRPLLGILAYDQCSNLANEVVLAALHCSTKLSEQRRNDLEQDTFVKLHCKAHIHRALQGTVRRNRQAFVNTACAMRRASSDCITVAPCYSALMTRVSTLRRASLPFVTGQDSESLFIRHILENAGLYLQEGLQHEQRQQHRAVSTERAKTTALARSRKR